MHVEKTQAQSVGLTETRYFTFCQGDDRMTLTCGAELGPITIAYETYGELNTSGSNAILICHALSGTAHAAGYHTPEDKYPGWWNEYIGPGKCFDTEKYYIICSNVIGGCNGSTGPASINPATGNHYALDFPMVTIEDMVQAQVHLIDHLGIGTLLAVAGGSMGGMQALSWAVHHPDRVKSTIAIATSALLSAQGIAFNEVGRQAIINDRNWNKGSYYESYAPDAGLSLARMIGHITYLSEEHMHEKFGRKFQEDNPDTYSFKTEYMVESYLHHQGIKFVDRFDANAYLYITRAIDLFDLKKGSDGSLIRAFEKAASNFLVISFTSDWLYPSVMSKEIVRALRANGKNVIYTDIESDKGHDTFLLDNPTLKRNISNFLRSEHEKVSNE